jgi:hypothetical protein
MVTFAVRSTPGRSVCVVGAAWVVLTFAQMHGSKESLKHSECKQSTKWRILNVRMGWRVQSCGSRH